MLEEKLPISVTCLYISLQNPNPVYIYIFLKDGEIK